jgi:putative FmdB family regulatory protein
VPVYEYKCTKCGEREEHILPAYDSPAPTECAACKGPLKKVFAGRVNVQLNGWGFSKTDGLISDTRGKDFKKIRERADRLRDS